MAIHTTSSPDYPLSNGKVENSVKLCKALMKKAIKTKLDIYLGKIETDVNCLIALFVYKVLFLIQSHLHLYQSLCF